MCKTTTMERGIRHMFSALLFMLFVLSVQSNERDSKPEYKPKKYKLEIITAEDHFRDASAKKELRFEGNVKIEIEAAEEIPADGIFSVTLNSNPHIKVKTAKIVKPEVQENCTHEVQNDKLKVTCKNDNKAGKAFELEIHYSNPFGNDMTGFYRSSYTNAAGETRWLLTTQFEPIFARNAFPCFDVPHLKATFGIKIKVPKNLKNYTTVLSNTEQISNAIEGEYNVYTFKDTDVRMSTYLVAFTVCDFKGTEPLNFINDFNSKKEEKKLRTYGRKEIIERNEGNLAQNIGKQALTNLTNYLEMGYALGKMDQVGIPDFSAGAMENFGHLSFREKSLFFNENTGTAQTKQANVLTITHELVHQWFGNLVTLKSWDYIWLNEGFANYIEYIIASKFKETTDWALENQLVVNEIHLRAFETDGFISSKPLNNIITDEKQYFSSFTDIPYCKGAAVLRMWNLQLKNDGFRKALVQYLKNRKENSATPEDLFSAFKDKKMEEDNFNLWTNQSGYPVVEVKKVNGTYKLSQSWFSWEDKENKTKFWPIPITYNSDVLKNYTTIPAYWLRKEPMTLNHTCKWIIINNQQAGYYRVNYDKENWEALSKALSFDHSKIPELNRAQIINDVFSLARSLQKNYVQYSTALELAKYLKKEKSFVPWKTALNSFEFLRTKIYNDDKNGKFKNYVLSLIKPHFISLNSSGLSHVDKLMNVELSRFACSLDFDKCVKEARDLYKEKRYEKLPDTREIILCTVVRNNDTVWTEVMEKYEKEQDSALKVMYISVLGCSNNKTQIKKFLDSTLMDPCNSKIRSQDLPFVLASVYNGNLNNIEIALEFIKNNYTEIAEKYGGINPLGRALVGISKKLKTKDQVDKFENLVNKVKNDTNLSAAKDSANDALNIAKSNVIWIQKRMKQVHDYINSGSFLTYSLSLLSLSLISIFQF